MIYFIVGLVIGCIIGYLVGYSRTKPDNDTIDRQDNW